MRPGIAHRFLKTILISIHALTKSATRDKIGKYPYVAISIHALTKSATAIYVNVNRNRVYFNPRTHKECDKGTSICGFIKIYFNPRTHKECDRFPWTDKHQLDIFQSTHSQRVRLHNFSFSFVNKKFQSTHSQRVRLY